MSTTPLPEDFADLQVYADTFAKSDDSERNDIEDKVSPELKRRLVDTVGPRLPAINQYLDQHDDEPAWHFGALAEATCEVALEVGWERESA